MKSKVIKLTPLLFAVLFTVFSSFSYSGADMQSKALLNDGNGIFLISYSGNKLYSEFFNTKHTSFTYTLDGKVISYCVIKDKIYILTKNNKKQNSCFIYKADNSKVSNPITINNIKTDNSSKLALDSAGNFYILNSSDKICVFNQSGKATVTFDKKITQLFPFSGYVLAFSGNCIYKVTKSSQTPLYNNTNTAMFYKISDNFIGDYYGNLYRVKNGITKNLGINSKGYYRAAQTDKYIVTYSNDKLSAYNKNGSFVNSVTSNSKLYGITSYKGKTALFKNNNSNYSYELLSDEAFNTDSPSQNSEEKTKGINLSAFKHTKNYIFVDSGTTIADLKSKIHYDSYDINFGNRRSGKIRTNNEVNFIKGNTKYHYIFIVRGDVTGTGNVNSRDETAVFNHILNKEKLNGVYRMAGNLNGDKKISNADLVLLSRLEK